MKKIIILDRLPDTKVGFQFLLWAEVPASRQKQYADPNKVSAYKDASTDELQALKDGKIVEKVEEIRFDKVKTMAEVKSALEERWTRFQNEVNSTNNWDYYGTYWDGTTWTKLGLD
jgi:hypothetical protein